MAYTIPQIITWMQVCQPLARRGQSKKRYTKGNNADVDLDMKLYNTRLDISYEYAQNPASSNLYAMGNYGLALCGVYLFIAQQASIGGGTVTAIAPGLAPNAYDFVVDSSSSFIQAGATSKIFPSNWIGYNILFVRNHVTQSIINDGFSTYYSWDRGTASLALFNGAAIAGETFQIYPFA